MIFRKKIGHCLAVFGPLLLLGSDTVAASLCHQVFVQKNISADSITMTIHDIAQLKVQADTILAAEQSSGLLPRKQALVLYKLKLDELIRSLEGQETIASLKQKIRDEIRNIQSKNRESKESERSEKVREDNIRHNNLISYDLIERHKLENVSSYVKQIKYFPESKKTIFSDISGIHTYDFGTKNVSTFGSSEAMFWKFSDDGKKLLAMDVSWDNILIYGTENGKLISSFPFNEIAQHAKLILSPDSTKILYFNHDYFALLSSTTGKEEGKFVEEQTKIPWIDDIQFTSDSELLIASGRNLYLYNLLNHTVVKRVGTHPGIPVLSSDRSQFTIARYEHAKQKQDVETYSTKDLSLITSSLLNVDFPNTPHEIETIPGTNDFLLRLGKDRNGQQDIQIAPKNDLDAYVFDWLDYYKKGDRDIEAFSFSPDAQELVIVSVEHGNGKIRKTDRSIDIWKRHHEKLTE
jgi:hypothetical protein